MIYGLPIGAKAKAPEMTYIVSSGALNSTHSLSSRQPSPLTQAVLHSTPS